MMTFNKNGDIKQKPDKKLNAIGHQYDIFEKIDLSAS